jgi:hypothetical protein
MVSLSMLTTSSMFFCIKKSPMLLGVKVPCNRKTPNMKQSKEFHLEELGGQMFQIFLSHTSGRSP